MFEKELEELNNKVCNLSGMNGEPVTDLSEYNSCLEEVDKIIEADSTNIEAYNLKSFILFCQEKFDEAALVCDEALRINPDNVQVLDFQAGCYFQAKKYAQCIAVCQHILSIAPNFENALSQWDSAYICADDSNLPKPPSNPVANVIQAVVYLFIAVVIGIFIYGIIR